MSKYCDTCANKGTVESECCSCITNAAIESSSNTPTKYKPKTIIPQNVDIKHLKGYMFDSLVFRYKDIRDRLAMYEVPRYMAQFNCSKADAEKKAMGQATDDMLRFIRILDEAIGEHD